MAPNHAGDPLKSNFGPMGSHWVKKMDQNLENYHAPKFEFSTTVIDFSQKMEFTVMLQSHGGDTLGSIMGPMGSHWVQKMGQNHKNYHAPKFEFSTTPRSSIFLKKWKSPLWRQIMVGTSYGQSWGQWGPIGSKKWIKTVRITMRKIRIFDYRFFFKKWK